MNDFQRDAQINGAGGAPFNSSNPVSNTSDILDALNAIHDPASTNETRRVASEHLEAIKSNPEAPKLGFSLATDKHQAPLVRHFGLSLLETYIRHTWYELPDENRKALRGWCIQLVQDIPDDDPSIIRNKVAQVWVELAKKCWALDWLDMDAYLVMLWDRSLASRDLVLSILEALSEDVFYREDAAAALRGNELNTALVEIFTSPQHLSGGIKIDDQIVKLRSSNEGWLERLSRFLDSFTQGNAHDQSLKASTIKTLATVRSVFSWIMPPEITSTRCLESVCMTLTLEDGEILLAAVEALHALYARQHLEDHDFQRLINPMYQPENVTLLQRLFVWSMVDCHDIDDTNLVVSIPALHSWVKIWASKTLGESVPVWSVVGELLETASRRIIRYEHFPEDSDDPTIVFLNEDIDTTPERHAFLGNYRRFCFQIIEGITERRPREAITHILAQTDTNLDQWQELDAQYDPTRAETKSTQQLQVDAQCTVVEAALRGYSRWVANRGKNPQQDERERVSLETSFEEWGSDFLARRVFQQPEVEHRIIKLALELSSRALSQNKSFALKVLQHLLNAIRKDEHVNAQYSESLKELHTLATNEMRRLTMRNAEYFATFFDQIETKVNDLLASWSLDERAEAELHAVLFVIFQRATNIEMEVRQTRLESFAIPVKNMWQDDDLTQSLSSFESFCHFLGLDQVGPYLHKIGAHHVEDWSVVQVNDEGLEIQADLARRLSRLPFRATKSLLSASTEKLKKDSKTYQLTIGLWHPCFPAILPNVLKLVSFAHQFNDRSTWSSLTPELQLIVHRILMDRFWQAGISTGTKEDFYAQITSTKSTLEGFGSSVRGKLRMVRESCYSILYCVSRLGDYLYSYPDLPEPLAKALFSNSSALSSHQFSVLLNMTKHLVDECPTTQIAHFCPAVLSMLFAHLDTKLTSAWSSIDERKNDITSNESALTEEMKEESILRGLTYNAAMLITSILDPHRLGQGARSEQAQPGQHDVQHSDSLRNFALSSPKILEPLLRLSAHALRMRDTRSCGVIVRVLQSMVPTFCVPAETQSDAETAHLVREFISTEVLQAAITSLNDNYFVDLQKDLAALIAKIWISYGISAAASAAPSAPDQPLSQMPRNVLCSLPGLAPERVDACAAKLGSDQNHRHQRAYVLSLLENIRGVSISEMGKIKTNVSSTQARRSAKERYSNKVEEAQKGPELADDGPDLAGLSEIFG
ncbi:MAG: hypothetical protein Q9227_001887 [Pyrenula ochraceoflavens]